MPTERTIVHYRRGDPILTSIHREGMLKLDPPSLEFDSNDLAEL